MIEDKVKKLIEKPLADIHIIVDSVSYVKEGGNYFLRIVIDRDVPIDVDTCVEVTHLVDPLLDEANFIEDSYILDITSKEKGDFRNE